MESKTRGTSETLEPWLAASQLGVTHERMQRRDNKVTARRPRPADERPPHETDVQVWDRSCSQRRKMDPPLIQFKLRGIKITRTSLARWVTTPEEIIS